MTGKTRTNAQQTACEGTEPVTHAVIVSGHVEIAVGTYVRKFEGAGFEGEVRAIYQSRKGVWMGVVEITAGPFAGMQHIYRLLQLKPATPSEWARG